MVRGTPIEIDGVSYTIAAEVRIRHEKSGGDVSLSWVSGKFITPDRPYIDAVSPAPPRTSAWCIVTCNDERSPEEGGEGMIQILPGDRIFVLRST
jgi:hypothetical protein